MQGIYQYSPLVDRKVTNDDQTEVAYHVNTLNAQTHGHFWYYINNERNQTVKWKYFVPLACIVPLLFSQASGDDSSLSQRIETTKQQIEHAQEEKSQAEQKLKLLSVNSMNNESARQESERLVAKLQDKENRTPQENSKLVAAKIELVQRQGLVERTQQAVDKLQGEVHEADEELAGLDVTLQALVAESQKPKEVEKPKETKSVENSTKIAKGGRRADGLYQHVAEARDQLAKKFGVEIGGYRPGDTDGMGTGHGDGLALDLMVGDNKALGDEIAQYVLANYQNLNVSYVIWQQRFWAPFNSIYGGPGQWGLMPDRGGVTANHYDHVHISFQP